MKGIYLIGIAFLASCTVITANEDLNRIPPTCPAEDSSNTTIYLPHECDCTKFYMCLAGKMTLKECPYINNKGDRMHFDPRRQVCDWPHPIKCNRCEQRLPEKLTNEQPKEVELYGTSLVIPTRCPAIDPNDTTIHLAHEYDCTKFYMCLGGDKILPPKDCPYRNKKGDRLHFNPRLQVCDWPGSAGCCTGPYPGEHCSNIVPERLIPHECNCSLYYEYKKGKAILRECEKNRYFSTRLQACVKFEDSDCGRTRSKCTREGELIPHECRCTKYYKCNGDLDLILQECKNGNHFSPIRLRCEHPDEAGCIPPRRRDEPGDCPKPIPVGLWRHECDCRLMYRCVNGKKDIMQCPWGWYFNEQKQKCDLPKNVDCKNPWDKF